MKRRAFITLLGGAAVAPALAPHAARAQQPPMPVIGFLLAASFESYASGFRAFRQSLKAAGYIEGENIAFEYRLADNDADRLPALAADLVRRQVAVIVSYGNAAALAAKAATAAIPSIFAVSEDPVRIGLVANLARPGGNVTGVNSLGAEVTAKRLELLRGLVPSAARVAVLVDPTAPVAASVVRDVDPAADAMGMKTQVFNVSTRDEINAAFEAMARARPDMLFVSGGFLFSSRRVQLALLAAHHSIPATYTNRDSVEAGGLMSYGPSASDVWIQMGTYTGRILKGAKPADLPVVQSSKFELVINAQTAHMLGLTVPPTLLATTDEVIE